MKRLKVLVATPAYGGQFTLPYFICSLNTERHIWQTDLVDSYDVYSLGTESLIGRGRNTCAKYAMDHGYDKLLFIDADMSWKPEWVEMLLRSDKKIIGGTYPLKSFPISLNFNPLEEHVKWFGKNRQLDNYQEFVKNCAEPNGEVEVRHIPTGFMLIDMSVFKTLASTKYAPHYITFAPDTKETKVFYDFFPCGVTGEQYESEDWRFCSNARAMGIKVYLQTQIVCGHVGVHHYQLGQHVIQGQLPIIGGEK